MACLDHHNNEQFNSIGVKNKTKQNGKAQKTNIAVKKLPGKPFYHEMLRLLTFSKYPRDIPCSAILLARNGFMYTGHGTAEDDMVTCAFCSSSGKGIRNLIGSKDIAKFHRKLNAQCSMVLGLDYWDKRIEESTSGSFEDILQQLESEENQKEENPITTAYGREPPGNESVPVFPESPSEKRQSIPNQNAQSTDDRKSSSPSKHSSGYSFQQVVEHGASSQIITNRSQSLPFPLLNTTVGSSLESAVNSTNSNPSLATDLSASNNEAARPDGSLLSTAQSNPPNQIHSNSTSFSPQNIPPGNQSRRPNTPQMSQEGLTNSDSSGNRQNSNPPSDPQTSVTNTTSTPSNLQSPSRNQSSPQNAENVSKGAASPYDKLGIYTSRPKRPEYAVEQVRLQSFEGWPSDHHLSPAKLAKAGYFYTGYSDCARCFYCSGGLRNWEVGDDAWVEHARWFPKCSFIRQNLGQAFIDVVKDLSKRQDMIPYKDVIKEMETRGLEIVVPRDVDDMEAELTKDISVQTVLDSGFTRDDVIKAAQTLKDMSLSLSCDQIFDELVKMGAKRFPLNIKRDPDSESVSTRGRSGPNKETLDSLVSENNDLRQQSQCKICLDKEVAVVFLPCGHFVSCGDCSYALKACPLCRQGIQGVVRGYLS